MRRPSLLALTLLSSACGGSPADASAEDFVPEVSERGVFQVRIALDEGAFRRGVNALTVRAVNTRGAPAQLTEVVARMPGHAHALARPTVRAHEGGYRIDDLAMTMAGRWVITFRFAQDGTVDEALAVTSLR
ncbi:MAG: hypothetical protein U0325_23585 [Polyangiales bacterium]